MAKLNLGRSVELKNGIGLDFGANMRILGSLHHRPKRSHFRRTPVRSRAVYAELQLYL